MLMTLATSERPKVILWFKVYAAVLAVIYLGLAAASLIFFLGDPAELGTSREGALVIGVLFLLMGLVLFGVFLLPLIVAPMPWLWTYDLVLICIGMTSACFIPACVPLLIFWMKPETKAHFGRQ